jgi:two-component system, NarL family, sensor histidine kinase DesK
MTTRDTDERREDRDRRKGTTGMEAQPDAGGIADPGAWPSREFLKPVLRLGGRFPDTMLTLLAPVASLGWPCWLVVRGLRRAHTPLFHWLLVLDTVLYGAGFVFALVYGTRPRPPARMALIGGLAGTGVGLAVLTGQASVLAYAVVATALITPVRWGRTLGLLVAPCVLVATWTVEDGPDWTAAVVLLLLALVLTALAQLNRTIAQLHDARETIRELTIVQERNRFAIDLHDLLGHSLTVITVKTALARRLLDTSGDIGEVATEVHDIEQLARRAMTEIRAAVSGYRTTSLDEEIGRARKALDAAGITAEFPRTASGVLPGLREPFAFVIREGITNVIKHSRATRCEVRLGADWLEIRDDGAGPVTAEDGKHDPVGHGLSGLAARLEAVGADLTASPQAGGGFVVRAEARPMGAPASDEEQDPAPGR